MKICTVIGARPQFIKAAAVSAKIAEMKTEGRDIEEVLIHTGQHYDEKMSAIFFDELNIPKEKYNLNVGSGSHGKQTGKMLSGIEDILKEEQPDWLLIYGDTNSTLAGALAAVKLHIPVAHVEAGMRSFNRSMPEEINRVVADHISSLNLCPTETAIANLAVEGRQDTAVLTGDVMYDCALKFADLAERHSKIMSCLQLADKNFILMTCHRAENTDSQENLSGIVDAVNAIAESTEVIYPIHPRTAKMLKSFDLSFSGKVRIIEPVSYFDMLVLEKKAKLVLTDSGGIQKEAFFYFTPCVTMREESEWIETIEAGWNITVGADSTKIKAAVANFATALPAKPESLPYGNGNAAEKIIDFMCSACP